MSVSRPFRFGVKAFSPPNRRGWTELARKAEALGYSTLSIDDHVDLPLAPLVALAVAAEATSTLRVGSLVFANDFRNPIMLAREAATLDVLSEGRLELGIGSGYAKSDYAAAGIPFDEPATRVSRLIESVRLMKLAFAGTESSFAGRWYAVEGLSFMPIPIQKPHPPLLIGGGRRQMLQLAAREADIVGINPATGGGTIDSSARSNSPEATDRKVAWVREAAGSRFDTLELHMLIPYVAVSADRRTAASDLLRRYHLEAVMSVDEMLASPQTLVGTEDEIADELQRRRERYGVSYVTVLDTTMDALAPVVAKLVGT